ncbi:MAG: hypothetical protein GF411_09220 [Candidatus Lokiarchaeota archaeon]|nr:hypothetical protein [Candidatus Lokiarchaeota archaeon]
MNKIDTLLPEIDLVPAIIIVGVLGLVFQLFGTWVLMLVVGFIGALLVRNSKNAFLAGFIGVALAWSILFAYLIATAQALQVADLFIGLLGLSGLGGVVIAISIIIGALLGGFGGLFGRSLVETLDSLLDDTKETNQEETDELPIENESE